MRRVITLITALTIFAGFFLTAAEAFQPEAFAAPESDELSLELSCFFPGQVEVPALLPDTSEHHTPPCREESQRYCSFLKPYEDGSTWYISRFNIGPKDGFVSIKDTILLRLRI